MRDKASVAFIIDAQCIHGESPVWSESENALYWVDLKNLDIGRWSAHDATIQRWSFSKMPCAIAIEKPMNLIVAFEDQIALFDCNTGAVSPLAELAADSAVVRFNDAKCDPQGRFWVGSMDRAEKNPIGDLNCIDRGRFFSQVDSGFTVANGPTFNLAGDVAYFVDSPQKCIFKYSLSSNHVGLEDKKIFSDALDLPGVPDGCATDYDNCLWSARWNGGCVVRHTPSGAVDQRVELPVNCPSSCAFGGENIELLFVTTVKHLEKPADFPLDGAILALNVGVRSIPAHTYVRH